MNRRRILLLAFLVLLLVGLGLWSPWTTPPPETTTPLRDRATDAQDEAGQTGPDANAAAAEPASEESGETDRPPGAEASAGETVDLPAAEAEEDPKPDPRTVPPAVRRNPRDPPAPRPGSRSVGGGRGPRPTGLWEKFPPEIPSGTATLAVLVLDRDDHPVPGADVYLGPPDVAGEAAVSYAHLRKLGQTDAEGRVVAEKLPEGSAAVAGNLNGLLNGPRGLDASSATTLVLQAQKTVETTLRLPVTLAAMGSVRGLVLGADGRPARGAQVFCGMFRVRPGKDGRFEIRNLPAGATTLSVQASGHRPVSRAIEIVAGETVEVSVELEYRESGTLSLRGSVLGPDDEAVPGATLYVMVTQGRSGRTVRSAVTDENGLYAMDALPDDLQTSNVRLQASRMGYRAAIAEFPEGLTTAIIDLRLPLRMTRLRLTVLDAGSEEPQTRCRLEATESETGKREALFSKRSTDGTYETWIAPGSYSFLVEAPAHEAHRATVVVPSAKTFEYTARLLPEGDTATEVSLTVVVTAAATGEPVETARVEVRKTSDGSAVAAIEGRREGGRFRLPAPSGEWRIHVEAQGFEAAEESVRLTPDEPEPEVRISLR